MRILSRLVALRACVYKKHCTGIESMCIVHLNNLNPTNQISRQSICIILPTNPMEGEVEPWIELKWTWSKGLISVEYGVHLISSINK